MQSEVKREKKEGGGAGQAAVMSSPGPPEMEEQAQPSFEELQGFTVVSFVTLRVPPLAPLLSSLCLFSSHQPN